MPPGTTCSPTSKDTTIVSGFIPLSGISPPNRESAKPLNPMSTKSGEGHYPNGTNGWPRVACLECKSARDRMPGRLHETLGPPRDAPFCRNACLVDQKPIVGNRNG